MLEKPVAQSPKAPTRRKVLQTAAWIAPAVVTLAVMPSFAGIASGQVAKPCDARSIDACD